MHKMKLLIFVTFILMQEAFAYETDKVTKSDVNNSTLLYSYICDDEILLNIEEKFKVIVEENGNFHNKLKFLIEENENLQNKMKLVDKLVDENDNLRLKFDTLTTITSSNNLQLAKFETTITNLTSTISILSTSMTQNESKNSIAASSFDQMMDALRNISDRMSSQQTDIKSLSALPTITSSINLQLAKFEGTITNLTSTISILSTSMRQNESTNSISSSCNDQMMDILRNISDSMRSQRTDIKSLLALPTSCAEAIAQNGYKSGIYEINLPEFKLKPFSVYCLVDPEQPSAPWTVIQRRQDGSIDFYRNWTKYQKGFGNLDGEFFIGLDILHALTQSTQHELWIKMEDFQNATASANYSSFLIGDGSEAYVLKTLGSYMGDVRDSLSYNVGHKFSTKDVDNDEWFANNCAVDRTGAWWYKYCADSNLNGQYLGNKIDRKGINWFNWHYNQQSLKYVHMAIRPVHKNK